MLKVLFSSTPERWESYREVLPAKLAAAGVEAEVSLTHAAEEVDYIVLAPGGPIADFAPFTKARAVMCLWAGVENVVANETLTQPLTRMVDTGLRDGMVEWVAGHVLRHHLGIDAHIANPDQCWDPVAPPLARDRPVTILGIGELGAACGQALARLGFPVTGWSRSPKDIPGLTCHHGFEGLRAALAGARIVVLLVPLTPETENLMNAATLALPAPGAVLLNPGRGALIDDDALLEALDTGQIGHATLDTFRIEPLPADHPFWSDPKVTVTPHIASETRPDTASEVIAENIRRAEAGEPLLYLVDRARGY